ncbi:MAG TPA: hypothetical protein VKR27_05630 [Acidimicrobiales bacterium]|nr:hypothetical protein [Acidimicrobiales bacterium]
MVSLKGIIAEIDKVTAQLRRPTFAKDDDALRALKVLEGVSGIIKGLCMQTKDNPEEFGQTVSVK